MPLSDFRSTHSWQEAINLGPNLVLLSEQLPVSEQMGLCWQLQQSMVELPQAIAVDLMQPTSMTRLTAAMRLVASLDLIEKIYPALDTADVRESVDTLVSRLHSDNFTETVAGSGPAPMPAPELDSTSVAPPPIPPTPAASVPVVPEGPAPLVTSVPVVAAQDPASASPAVSPDPLDVAPHTVPVAVEEADEVAQENHVRTDSF